MVETGAGSVETLDGQHLYYQWQRAAEAKSVVLIVHGVAEHIGRYNELQDWFRRRGFTCYGFDQRGHGRSTGRRTHVDDFHEYVSDLSRIVELVKQQEPGLPIYLYGHSMGAIVALLAVLHDPSDYVGVVIASPAVAIGDNVPTSLRGVVGLLGTLLPRFRVRSRIRPDFLTHDPVIVDAYGRDELVVRTVTLGWLTNMLAAQHDSLNMVPGLATPVLALHSMSDRVASIDGTRQLVRQMPRDLVTYHEYDGLYHELHNETVAERSAVLADVSEWFCGFAQTSAY